MANGTYIWKRFWHRRDTFINLDNNGFLLDPDGPYGDFNPHALPFERIKEVPCLALLGEPGMGKTRALRDHYEKHHTSQSQGSLWIDLRSYSDEDRLKRSIFDSEQVLDWINSPFDFELFLDSLDECLIHIRTVAALLVDELKKYPTTRLKLRIACRTAEWPSLLDEELRAIWGEEKFEAFELAPLRRIDVIHDAESSRLPASQFLAAIEEQDVVPLARTPITLGFLLKTFEGHKLPGTRSELYERGCLRLVSYTGPSRLASGDRGTLSSRQRLALAERIAAVSVFSKRSSCLVEQDGVPQTPEDVRLDELSLGEELAEERPVPATEANLREVLQTSLFGDRGLQRRGWSHWSYAEYLAARFLVTREFTDDQIRDLIFHPESTDRRKVIPQLHEVAAWISTMNARILSEILSADPQVLLRSTVMNADGPTRSRLVETLLRLFDSEELVDVDAEHRYEVLCHSGLPDQLRTYMRERARNIVVRRVAIHIAEACKATELLPDLLKISLDKSEDHHIRDRAAHAIASFGDIEHRMAMAPLLECGPEEDPDDQLRGNALRALLGQLPVEEIFSHITPPRQENFFGSYQAFLQYELPKELSSTSLPVALSWISGDSAGQLGSFVFNDLAEAILKTAPKYFDNPAVVEAYADALLTRALWHAATDREGLDELTLPRRRQLISAIVRRGDEKDPILLSHRLRDAGIITKDDFSWYIEQLQASAGCPDEKIWARFIAESYNNSDISHLEQAFQAKEDSSFLGELLAPYFDPQPLDSPHAQWYRKEQEEKANRKKGTLSPPVKDRVLNHLDAFESGDLDAWWVLNMDLTLGPFSKHYNFQQELISDLTLLTPWEELDESTQARCVDAAERYLREADPKTSSWLGTNTFHRPAAAGYRALRLLRKLRAETISALPDLVWSTWAPVIVAFPESPAAATAEENQVLVAMAYSHAPESVIQAVKALIDKENRDHGHLFVLYKLHLAWDVRLASELLDHGRTKVDLKPESLGNLLEVVLPHLPDEGLEFGLTQLASSTDGENEHLRAVEAAVALLKTVPSLAWNEVWSAIRSNSRLGRDIFTKYAYQTDEGRRALSHKLGEDFLADLFIWLHQQFPDMDLPSGPHSVGEEETVLWLKQGLLTSLRERGTKEAVDAIRRIASSSPEISWLKYTAINADKIRLEKSWDGVAPDVLLKMASNRQLRIGESEKRSEVFISYAWGDDTPEGKMREKVVDELYSALESDGFLPVRDQNQMRPGDRISAFMRRLTQADLVVAVISEKYLRSTYCMYEIYKLWQRCQGDADELVERLVPIVLPEVRIGNFEERAPYLEHWSEQATKLEELIRKPNLRPGAESWEEVRLVREFAHHVDDILVFVQDVLMPRKLEAHLDDGFQAVREALRRRIGR